jgi:hypothetical protein
MDAMKAVLMPYAMFPMPPVFEVPTFSDRVKMTKPLQQHQILVLLLQVATMMIN